VFMVIIQELLFVTFWPKVLWVMGLDLYVVLQLRTVFVHHTSHF
jgi:hypothetical protein